MNNRRHAWPLVLGSRQVTRAIFNLHCQEILSGISAERNSTKMEFLNVIFIRVSGHKLESSQTRGFVFVFYPHFSILQTSIDE